MNRSPFRVLVISLCAVTAFGVGACSGTEPNPPPGGDGGVVDAGGGGNDAGLDAGMDAGTDAGLDAGMDAGSDAGLDAGETDAGMDAGEADAGVDAGFEGIQCGDSVCTGGDQCCGDFDGGTVALSCAATCPDGGAVITCDGPEDCDGGSPICCGTVTTGPGTPPNCPAESVVASCSSTCTSDIPLSCDNEMQVVRCHERADCSGAGTYSECCTFQQASNTGSFCVTSTIAFFADSCAP